MKKLVPIIALLTFAATLTSFVYEDNEYLIIAWNDLGMHCANKDFSEIAILPPYNNFLAQVVRRGDENRNPALETNWLTVKYSIPGNTYSVGKTNFWDYEDELFGVDLENNIGLTGVGLTGELEAFDDYFTVEGIPVTPYADDDLENENPYMLCRVELFDPDENMIAFTRNVIPVSNEISCVNPDCHPSTTDIINEHEDEGGFDRNKRPILCAECHASNALGTEGDHEAGPLSFRIHDQHSEKTDDCYKCHPGKNTQCQRGVMFDKGLICQDCHGDLFQVARSIKQGREPWLEEPRCGDAECHGADFAEEEGKLFRQSRGHGNLFCSACHGSPHAILPSTVDNDNLQAIALQGEADHLKKCEICHGFTPQEPGPHDMIASSVNLTDGAFGESTAIANVYPNPGRGAVTLDLDIPQSGRIELKLVDPDGRTVAIIEKGFVAKGNYSVSFNLVFLPTGVYFILLERAGEVHIRKIVVAGDR